MTKPLIHQLPQVHIYGQPSWHDNAHVIGNRAGLEALRDAINDALRTGAQQAEVYATDGEGYGIKVVELADAILDEMPLPYTDPEAREMVTKPWPDVVRRAVIELNRKRRAGQGS